MCVARCVDTFCGSFFGPPCSSVLRVARVPRVMGRALGGIGGRFSGGRRREKRGYWQQKQVSSFALSFALSLSLLLRTHKNKAVLKS